MSFLQKQDLLFLFKSRVLPFEQLIFEALVIFPRLLSSISTITNWKWLWHWNPYKQPQNLQTLDSQWVNYFVILVLVADCCRYLQDYIVLNCNMCSLKTSGGGHCGEEHQSYLHKSLQQFPELNPVSLRSKAIVIKLNRRLLCFQLQAFKDCGALREIHSSFYFPLILFFLLFSPAGW